MFSNTTDCRLCFPSKEQIIDHLSSHRTLRGGDGWIFTDHAQEKIEQAVAQFFANQTESPLGLENNARVVLCGLGLGLSKDELDDLSSCLVRALVNCAKLERDPSLPPRNALNYYCRKDSYYDL